MKLKVYAFTTVFRILRNGLVQFEDQASSDGISADGKHESAAGGNPELLAGGVAQDSGRGGVGRAAGAAGEGRDGLQRGQ